MKRAVPSPSRAAHLLQRAVGCAGAARNDVRGAWVRGLAAMAVTAAVVAPAAAQQAAPKVDLARGQKIAAEVCAACHGADGNAPTPANPKLAAQHADYLHRQLVAFVPQKGAQAATRANAVMLGFAQTLSEDDRRALAAFYAGQALKPSAAKDKNTVEIGQRIYRAGIPEKQVPACAGCHGPNGAGIPSQYPRLHGQWAEYTEAQLIAFRDGVRRNSAQMAGVASRMSDREIKAVADFIAGLR